MGELLSICPTNWGMTPRQAIQWLEEKMIPFYALGDYKVNPSVADIKI